MDAQSWTWLLFIAVVASGLLGWLLGRRGQASISVADEPRPMSEASKELHALLDAADAAIQEWLTGYVAIPQKAAPVKAEPLYEDDEDTEPFEISLQLYGDGVDGCTAQSLIFEALNQWSRAGMPRTFTSSRDMRLHVIDRTVTRKPEAEIEFVTKCRLGPLAYEQWRDWS